MSTDLAYMAHALQLAARGHFSTSPNPRVGCVLVKNGVTIAEGWHIAAVARMQKSMHCNRQEQLPAALLPL
jgi:pyrimidine deaminase RibD-like protein